MECLSTERVAIALLSWVICLSYQTQHFWGIGIVCVCVCVLMKRSYSKYFVHIAFMISTFFHFVSSLWQNFILFYFIKYIVIVFILWKLHMNTNTHNTHRHCVLILSIFHYLLQESLTFLLSYLIFCIVIIIIYLFILINIFQIYNSVGLSSRSWQNYQKPLLQMNLLLSVTVNYK